MIRARASATAIAAALAVGLYLLPVPYRGLVGPDEPRYASIAREMSESGDLVTPVLWGEPWFEKPAMLFWLGAAGHAAGLEAYTRVPVALLCLGFLGFFRWKLRREFDSVTANAAACILATSAGWVAYSDAGVFDAPVTVFVSAALLCLLPWARGQETPNRRTTAWFGALLGLGVLSKGLVAPAVAFFAVLPVVARRPRRVLDLWGPRALLPFLAVCLPWYLACYLRNGSVFVEEFLVRHHWHRFLNSSLQHVQPWWFFVPVLLVFLLPWTPLLLGCRAKAMWRDPSQRFLSCWALGSFVFFSASVNKLPAYILPVLPPLAVLMAIQWKAGPRRRLLAAGACTLVLVPLAGTLIPPALADGVTRAWADLTPGSLLGGVLVGFALAGLAGLAALKARPSVAVPLVAAVTALALALIKLEAYPPASRVAGTRELLAGDPASLGQACIGEVRRHTGYGLRHYTRDTIPSCEDEPRAFRIEGDPPLIVPNSRTRQEAREEDP